MPRISLLCCALFVITTTVATAAAWPDSWIGPADNSYRELHVKVYYYGAVLHDLPDADGIRPLPDDGTDWLAVLAGRDELAFQDMEYLRVREEVTEGCRFFWRNTRFNLAINTEWVVDYEPRLRSTIASSEAPYHSPVEHPVYAGEREKYDGLVQIMVMYRYNEETGELERIKGGGGFTWGLNAETMECGWSWWAACSDDNVCGSDWLMVHEFGHQIDSMFEQSGHPEFWFNHLAPSQGNVARFGEHFDANSYILRRVPEADWHDLLWGELKEFVDADGDHVPDPDNNLMQMELETDPDPASADADGDGFADYSEFMASNGNRVGHGERLHPGITICCPTIADTDKDGLTDGQDPSPSLPMLAGIPHILSESPTEPAVITVDPSGDIPGLSVELSYSGITDWEDETQVNDLLLIEFEPLTTVPDQPVEFKIMLDLDNDGWFTGDDNYQIMVENGTVTRLIRHEAASSTEWPHAEDLDPAEYGVDTSAYVSGPDGRLTTLILEKSLFPELAARPGEIIGFNIGVRQADTPWFYMLGEPNTLVPLELH